jgi:pimeloyl-ACP methyl ester carboxylesterase
MTTRAIFPLLTGIVLLLALAACAPNRPYRTRLPVEYLTEAKTDRPPSAPVLGPVGETQSLETWPNGNGFNLGFVEFDDRGWFWSKDQWLALKNAIRHEAETATNGLTVMVMVHGWKNNASSNSWNVVMFRRSLEDLSRHLGTRKLFGVYIGWRGETWESDLFPIPLGSAATFWDRKRVAERIGYQGAATQLFREMQQMQEDVNSRLTNSPARRMELIIIGHSFGGQVVYSALSQVLTERLTQAENKKPPQPISTLGDQVILLNPAFEAAIFDNLLALAGSKEISYATNQQPLLTIFTSESDKATGLAFPAGRILGSLFDSVRPGKGTGEQWLFNVRKDNTKGQRTAIFKTVGHDKDYLNFKLSYTNYGAKPLPSKRMEQATNSMQQIVQDSIHFDKGTNVLKPRKGPVPYYFPNSITTTNKLGRVKTENYACVLQAFNTNALGTPLLNVTVDRQIMNGHNDINNPHLQRFLLDFIEFSRTNYMQPKNH